MTSRVIQVIETKTTRGDGKNTVLRGVTQYFSFDGKLLAENDPFASLDDGAETAALPEND